MSDPRRELSERYLRGSGIEIGGLHYPLPVLPGCKVTYIDRMSLEDLKRTADVIPAELSIVVDDAESLKSIATNSIDFLIANHVFEHCLDPVKTMSLWVSKLKPGGYIYAAIPDKTQTFDQPRAVTTWEHIWNDFRLGGRSTAKEHYREWFTLVDKYPTDQIENKVEQCYRDETNIHFHVWDRAAQEEMMGHLAEISGFNGFSIQEAVQNGAEIIWVIQRK